MFICTLLKLCSAVYISATRPTKCKAWNPEFLSFKPSVDSTMKSSLTERDMSCCLQALSASRQASYHTLEVNLEDLKKEKAGLQAEVKLLQLQLSQVGLIVGQNLHHNPYLTTTLPRWSLSDCLLHTAEHHQRHMAKQPPAI